MRNNNLEELFYEYGHIQYKIGRMETDEKSNTKDYSKAVAEKERLAEAFRVVCKKN